MPVVTRSTSNKSSETPRADAHDIDTKHEPGELLSDPFLDSLERLEDEAIAHGRDVNSLHDATSSAIAQVRSDSQAASVLLSKKINDGNAALAQKLNESFAVVGQRLDSLPTVAMLQQGPEGPKVAPFAGSTDQGPQFSMWLRRLEDVMRMRPNLLSNEQKANFLIGHLDGMAREKVEELPIEARKDFSSLVSHLTAFFESPQQRYVARQKLSVCRQEPGESCSAFANRILHLVRAATSGQDAAIQMDRVLEEFVARLRGDIRYFVKLDNPTTFDQAVTKAQTVEQLLSEAAAERLITPTAALNTATQAGGPPPFVQVAMRPNRTPGPFISRRRQAPTLDLPQEYEAPSRGAPQMRPARSAPRTVPTWSECFNCGGTGHFRRDCPSACQASRRPPRMSRWSPRVDRGVQSFSRQQPRSRQCDIRTFQRVDDVVAVEDARSRIAQLSLSLKDQQSQLDQSQARIAALLQRNEELARSTFEKPSSPSGRGSLPDVRLLLLCAMSVSLLGTPVSASSAWLCPKENPTNLFFVPDAYNCSGLLPNSSSHLDRVTLQIFRPNTKMFSSPASFCRIIRHSVTYSVNFFGARREAHAETHLAVSSEECRQMAKHHRCAHGALEEYAGLWRTRHDLAFDFPSAPFGCCTDHTVTVTNCYLASTTVYAHHNDPVPQSSVGDLSSCLYKDGTCTLHDGSVVVWTPDPEEECHYIFLSKMSGWFTGTIWLSDSREFSLSWNENSTRTVDCFKQFIVTDQGYAIQMSRRLTRSTDAEVGLVTSNQLSAQLLAVEGSVHAAALSIFRHALQSVCERTLVLSTFLASALHTSPTLTMRHLLARPDIMATYEGSGYVQVRRCIPIPSSSVRFLPFNGTCFSLPMVQINLPSGFQGHAFLDPTTNIIQGKASTIDCTDSQPFIVASADGIRRFSPLEGSFATVSPDKITVVSSFPRIKSLPVAPQLTIFHNLILTNFSDVSDNNQLRELWTALDHEKLMDHFTRITSPRSPHLASEEQDPPLAVPRSPRPSILPVTVTTSSSRVAHPPPRSPIALDISQVEIDFSDSWPPKASTVPMSVLAVDGPVPFFVAQVPIRANGVNLLALVDTGAGITVASQSLLPLLGIFRMSPSQIPAAVGIAGIPVPFVGSASVYLQIGKIALNQVIHFTEADCIPRTADAYNVILGNDLLQRLPSWSLNYNQRVFLLDGETIPVVQSSVPHRSALPEIPAGGVSVRASSTVVLPPGTETLVHCYLTEASPTWSSVWTEAELLCDENVFVAPTVFPVQEAVLCLSNPSNTPRVIYKDQCLTTAKPLLELADGVVQEPMQCF